MDIKHGSSTGRDRFEEQAEARSGGAMGDVWYFFRHSKKWWLAPIVIVIVLFGLLVVLGGSGAAPFIYTLF